LLITTRDPLLPADEYRPSQTTAHRELTGLAPTDALELAGSILENTGIAPPRDELLRLLDFLGGHPLSLHLVVPQLHAYTPAQLIAEFDKLLPDFSKGAGKTKDESLRISLELSVNRLDAATRARLPQLAVFQGGAFEPMIRDITDFTEEEWARVRPQLARAALIRIEQLAGVASPYIHFHLTLAPYLASTPTLTLPRCAKTAEQEREQGVGVKYRRAYHALARQLYHADDKTPIQARSIVIREMANLRRALALMLDAGELDVAVELAEIVAMFLNQFGRWRERDEVVKAVNSKQSTVNSGAKLTKAEYLLESRKEQTFLSDGKAVEAERVIRNLLSRMGAEADFDIGFARVTLFVDLGRSLRAQGQATNAAQTYRVALDEAKKLEQSDAVKRKVGFLHTDLADVLTDLGRYDKARKEYEAALEIV
jgi:tetratricopeptide (TPR) repeat protein